MTGDLMIFFALFFAQTIRIAIPYLFAAAGGVVAERAGVVSLTLEGFMITGAFGATLGSYYTGSPWIGVLCGMGGGLLFGLIHAVASIRFRADQIVTGIALNLLALGLTRYLLRLFFGSASNSPRVEGLTSQAAGESLVAPMLRNPLIWLGIIIMPVLAWVVYRTAFGLRVRAVGEHPEAASTLGIPVNRVRYAAVALSGVLASLGGVYLALEQHQFTSNMIAGRGFIALAAIIFGRWDPVRAGIACLLFAAAETLQIQLQGAAVVPSQFVQMIPYLLTLIALAGLVGRAVPPAALGKAH
jgi:general nucleoside transport system permease protein